MKKIFLTIFLIAFLGLLARADLSFAQEDNYICAVYFTGVGCPHCANADPLILENLPKEHPNLIFIEYEIYQQRENAPLIEKYSQNYNSGLGIPLVIFNKDNYIVGDRPILENVRESIDKIKKNPCPLADGSSQDFKSLNLAVLAGKPKIWQGDRILINVGEENEWVFGWNGQAAEKQNSTDINPNDILQKLISAENIPGLLNEIKYSSIDGPIAVPLSGKYVNFENAIDLRVKLDKETPVNTELTFFKIISLAAVDAINPCALSVLALMIIAILTYNPTKRKNILLAGFAFILSVFLMYLLYGLIIVKSFQVIQALATVRLWLYKILGFGAIILGCFKIKDFLQHKTTCKISPRVDKIISKITSPKGAFLVGAFVTIFLLPCTIGPYIICGGILSALCTFKALSWLLFYNLIFILPMVGVVLIIYFGLSKIEDISSWEARNIKYLDLISGLIILGLGMAMILGLV